MDCLRQAHTTGIATTTLHDMVMQPLRASARLLSSTVARHAAGTHVYVPPTEPSPRYFVIATFLGGMAAMVYGGLHFLATLPPPPPTTAQRITALEARIAVIDGKLDNVLRLRQPGELVIDHQAPMHPQGSGEP
eukprot:m.158297 g.158297  ORF g.158297 m.158297 type:complete len:134 (-) comp9821_c0_seq2:250-651(-)